MENEILVHPQSMRALAYEVLNQLYGAGPVDDSNISIYQIEAELRHQYGPLLEKEDQTRLRLGQKPDPSRVKPTQITLSDAPCESCQPDQRIAVLSDYLAWNGVPYITDVSVCGVRMVPVENAWQLPIVLKRTGKPTYCIEGGELASKIIVHLTPKTIGITELDVRGALKDPYYGLNRDDVVYWQTPWNISEAFRALIKERAEIRLRGGSVATWQRADRKNNGVETPVNQPVN